MLAFFKTIEALFAGFVILGGTLGIGTIVFQMLEDGELPVLWIMLLIAEWIGISLLWFML